MKDDLKQIIDQIGEEQRKDPLGLPAGATSLEFHQAVYRNASLPISTRQRSAQAALPFEYQKLAVKMNMRNFVEELEAAIERANKQTEKVRRGEIATNGAKLIEAKPEPFKRRV